MSRRRIRERINLSAKMTFATGSIREEVKKIYFVLLFSVWLPQTLETNVSSTIYLNTLPSEYLLRTSIQLTNFSSYDIQTDSVFSKKYQSDNNWTSIASTSLLGNFTVIPPDTVMVQSPYIASTKSASFSEGPVYSTSYFQNSTELLSKPTENTTASTGLWVNTSPSSFLRWSSNALSSNNRTSDIFNRTYISQTTEILFTDTSIEVGTTSALPPVPFGNLSILHKNQTVNSTFSTKVQSPSQTLLLTTNESRVVMNYTEYSSITPEKSSWQSPVMPSSLNTSFHSPTRSQFSSSRNLNISTLTESRSYSQVQASTFQPLSTENKTGPSLQFILNSTSTWQGVSSTRIGINTGNNSTVALILSTSAIPVTSLKSSFYSLTYNKSTWLSGMSRSHNVSSTSLSPSKTVEYSKSSYVKNLLPSTSLTQFVTISVYSTKAHVNYTLRPSNETSREKTIKQSTHFSVEEQGTTLVNYTLRPSNETSREKTIKQSTHFSAEEQGFSTLSPHSKITPVGTTSIIAVTSSIIAIPKPRGKNNLNGSLVVLALEFKEKKYTHVSNISDKDVLEQLRRAIENSLQKRFQAILNDPDLVVTVTLLRDGSIIADFVLGFSTNQYQNITIVKEKILSNLTSGNFSLKDDDLSLKIAESGLTLKDINECTTGLSRCHSKASCTNTALSYKCTCKPDYEGNGFDCTKKNDKIIVIVAVTCAIFFGGIILVLLFGLIFCLRGRKDKTQSLDSFGSVGHSNDDWTNIDWDVIMPGLRAKSTYSVKQAIHLERYGEVNTGYNEEEDSMYKNGKTGIRNGSHLINGNGQVNNANGKLNYTYYGEHEETTTI